jgi:phosphatidylglycerophosphate synthase
MESISLKQLREFKYRINPEERQGAYGYYFIRPLSLYVTYFALRFGLTANQVTVLQTVFGLAGAVCLAVPSPAWSILAILFLQFGFVLDNVDGEVARFRNQVSLTGKYLDTIGHTIVIPCMYFGLGIGNYLLLGHFESVIFGFLAGFFSIRLDFSILYHEAAQLLETKLDKSYDYYSKLDLPQEKSSNMYRKKNEESWTRMLYAIFAYPSIMNIISILIIFDLFIPEFALFGSKINLVYIFLASYGILLPIRRAYTIRKLAKRREVERKYLSLLKLFDDRERQ